MKRKQLLFISLFICFTAFLQAQTDGTLTFNFTTIQQGTKSRQVMGVWIENATGTFLKTNLIYTTSGNTDDHFPVLSAKNGANVVSTADDGVSNMDVTTGNNIDAITGATRSNSTSPLAWGAYLVSWNGRTGAGN